MNRSGKDLAATTEREPTTIGSASAVTRFLQSPKQERFPTDPLARHIAQVLALHPSVSVRFRDVDLANMDAATKQALLEDINLVLGIGPLSTPHG